MRIELDVGTQWGCNYGFNFISIGVFRGEHMKSLCFTFMGFWIDLDFIK